MQQSDIIKSTKAVLAIADDNEFEEVKKMLEKSGFSDIERAGNALEMILASDRIKRKLVIADTGIGLIDLRSALDHIAANDSFATIALISDDWAAEKDDELINSCDVFLTRPVKERALMPGVTLDVIRKHHLKELADELRDSEKSFAEDKNMGFAKRLIMDELGLSQEGAGDYILSLSRKYGYDEGDVAGIAYDVLLARDKQNSL